MMFRGDFDAGIRELDAALRCSPFDLGLQMNGGEFLGWAGRLEEAAQRLRGCLDLGPHFWPARHRLAEILAAGGAAAEAHEQIELAMPTSPPARLMVARATVHALLGERGPALALVDEIEAAVSRSLASAADIARLHALLGRADRAFEWIDIGIADRLPRMLTLAVDLAYEGLRGDSRLAARVQTIGVGPAGERNRR
jgi:tetratricopeptide (TPR) repeat protein